MAFEYKSTSGIGDSISFPTITLEEHFTTGDYLRVTCPYSGTMGNSKLLEDQLLDLDEGRISAMDAGGVDVQVLSLAASAQDKLPKEDATSAVRDANDVAYAATQRHPNRLAMFVNLALGDPEAAAKELERGITKLGAAGGFLNGTEGGAFLDAPRYTPICEAAQALEATLYLHPTPPQPTVRDAYFSGLPEASAYLLSTVAWGWHSELGMHCLRLVLGGVFDKFPRLRIAVGHMGENLPFSLFRAQV